MPYITVESFWASFVFLGALGLCVMCVVANWIKEDNDGKY